MSAAEKFNITLINISKSLKSFEKKKLAFLAGGTVRGLGGKKSDDTLSLFEELKHRSVLAEDDTAFLKELLVACGRRDLAHKLKARGPTRVCSFRALLCEVFQDLSEDDIGQMRFLIEIPQSIQTADWVDLCTYLLHDRGLTPRYTAQVRRHLDNIGRCDLAQKLEQYKDSHGLIEAPYDPPKKKCAIFQREAYQFVDEHVKKLPGDLVYLPITEAVNEVNNYGKWNDSVATIRALFYWTVTLDYKKVDSTRRQDGTASDFILQSSAFPRKIAELMEILCRKVGIECLVVKGQRRFEDGATGDAARCASFWNAVYIAGCWRLIHPKPQIYYYGGLEPAKWTELERSDGCPKPSPAGDSFIAVSEFHFLADREVFQRAYYPEEHQDILKSRNFSMEDFDRGVLLKEKFYDLGMSLISQSKTEGNPITTESSNVDICFGVPSEKEVPYKFEYCLYTDNSASVQRLKYPLKQFVIYAQRHDKLQYRLRLPITGHFKFKVWGGTKGLSQCFTYFIDCTNVSEDCQPLPDIPCIGWGPGPVSEHFGLKPVSHDDIAVSCPTGHTKIKLSLHQPCDFQRIVKHIELDQVQLADCCVMETEQEQVNLHLRLPQGGEFALKLFANSPRLGWSAENALNYLIESGGGATSRPFPNVLNGVFGSRRPESEAYKVKIGSCSNSSWLQVENKDLTFELSADEGVVLLFELHSYNTEASRNMLCTVMPMDDKCTWKVSLFMPVEAEYALNVFARRTGDVDSAIFGVHSFLISAVCKDSKESPANEKVQKIPTRSMNVDFGEVKVPIQNGGKKVMLSIEPQTGKSTQFPAKTTVLDGKPESLLIADFFSEGDYILNVYLLHPNCHKVQVSARVYVTKTKNAPLPAPLPLFNIDGKCMEELIGYNRPPDGVFQVVQAFFLLLGYHTVEVKTWERLKRLLQHRHGQTVKEKVVMFDPHKVDEVACKNTQKVLYNLKRSEIKIHSPGAKIIFEWVSDKLPDQQ